MKYAMYTIIMLLAFVLSRDFFGHITLGGAIPNLNLLLVLIVATESSEPDFLFLAFIGGILTDIGFGVPIGTYTLAFMLAGGLVYQIFHGALSVSVSWKNLGFVIVLGVLLAYVLTVFISKAMIFTHIMPYSFQFTDLKHILLPTLFYNLIVAFPLYWLYAIVQNYFAQFNRQTYKLR